jgi:hypothetical protein
MTLASAVRGDSVDGASGQGYKNATKVNVTDIKVATHHHSDSRGHISCGRKGMRRNWAPLALFALLKRANLKYLA